MIIGRLTRAIALALLLGLAAANGIARAGTPDDVVAVVGSTVIGRATLDAEAASALGALQRDHESAVRRLELKLHTERARILESGVAQLLDARVLELESARTGLSPEQLLAAIVAAPIGDAEVRAFYDARRRQITQPFERIAGQIRQYLESQARAAAQAAFLGGLRERYGAVSRLEPLRFAVDSAGPSRGPASAPVTIVEFADFQCPYCAEMEPVLTELRAAYPADVRFVYRHLPLVSLHPHALSTARAAVCADAQGRFWDFHDALFADQSVVADDALTALARHLGLDGEAFDRCLASDAPQRQVLADARAADALGLGSTPAFLVNGRLVSGTTSTGQLRALIDDERARRRNPTTISRNTGP